MKYLSREDILNINDFETEEVEVPEWNGTVLVKSMTGQERDKFEASLYNFKGGTRKANPENIRAKLVALTVVDAESFEPIFTPADIELLGKKSVRALNRIFEVAQKLSGITDDDVEDLAKNSKTDL